MIDTDYVPRPRSWLFVPGNRQRFVDKAELSGADGMFLDLEDGVLPADKAPARDMVAATLARDWRGPLRYVRVNAFTTPWLEDDLRAIVCAGLDGICLSKTGDADEVRRTSEMLSTLERERGLQEGRVRIVAAIEGARPLVGAPAIAAADPRITALIFGAEDYSLDVGMGTKRVGEAADMIYARCAIVNAAAAANVGSIDTLFPDLDDPDGLVASTQLARRLGFSSKSTFNPRQVETINAIFSPQPDEIAYAQRVAEGFREAERRGDASVSVGGQLVDRPILLRAIRILKAVGAWES